MMSSTYSKNWNLTTLFRDDNDPQITKEQQQILVQTKAFVNKWQKRHDYLTDSAVLLIALGEYEAWSAHCAHGGVAAYYFWLRTQQDQSNTSIKARLNQLELASVQAWNQIQFFELNLAKIPPNQQKHFLNAPALKAYYYFLKRLFDQAPYQLSQEQEEILNLKSLPAHANWVRMVSTLLAKEQRAVITRSGKKKTTSFSQILGLINNIQKPIRDDAAAAFNEILSRHADVAEQELNAVLQNKQIDDQLRGLPCPETARHLSDDMETAVVDTLVATVAKRYALAHRYYRLKAKLLGLKKLEYHERNLPIGNSTQPYSFEDSIKLVATTFKQLDPQFHQILKQYLSQGQIDVLPKKGKVSGAFCAHHLPKLPTYILLNHTNQLTDVTTFAHELGHGINNELIKATQLPLYFGTPVSTAEVASTFMEDFVLETLIQDLPEKEKLTILMEKLNNDISTILRQIAFYQFEQQLHTEFRKQGYLDKNAIGTLFQTHMKAFMGPAVKASPGSQNWWIYVSHFRSFFYVYSYASGLLISKALQHMVRDNPQSIQKVKTFLSAGLSASPRQLFKQLGIDITQAAFWNQGLDAVEDLLRQTERLASNTKL